MRPQCPLCRRRKPRRVCPALGQTICAVCCGTKRLVEISCPPDCAYLASSQAHPPAVVQRQQERDTIFAFPLLQGLTSRQNKLLLLVQGFLRRERPDAPALVDNDVAQATRALAETYDTASRGIIYDHQAGLPSAQRLAADIRTLIEAARGQGLNAGDAEVATVLRRIERAAREARTALCGDSTAYLGFLKRVLREPGSTPAAADSTGPGGSGLIVPGR